MTSIQRAILIIGGLVLLSMSASTFNSGYDHPTSATFQFLAAVVLIYLAARRSQPQ